MKISQFLKTIYLGDRACKSITVNGWNSEVKIQINCISRIRSENWDFYDAEDLPDGFLVFEGVHKIEFDPTGHLPNDLINDIYLDEQRKSDTAECVVLNVDSVDSDGVRTELLIRIFANAISLEANGMPDQRIRT